MKVRDMTNSGSANLKKYLWTLVHNNQENRKYRLSVSVGHVSYDPENPCSLDELMAHADKLMYEQKKSKKDLLLQEASLANRNFQ